MQVPFIHPKIKFIDLFRMYKSLKSTWLVYGKYTKKFELDLAKYLQVPEVVATSSCTSALELALQLSNIGTGDEVITTPISWVATSNVILKTGALPVFVDIEAETGLIDINLIEKSITSKTRAILFVDLYGQTLDIERMRKIADNHNIKLIEDAAHALEAKSNGFSPGQLSDYAAFSFHAAKNITSGQGGALTLKSSPEAEKARILRRDGVYNQPDGKRRMIYLGNKFDSTDFQFALLIGQIKRIDRNLRRRRKIFRRYEKLLGKTNIRYAKHRDLESSACHLFTINVSSTKRDYVRSRLSEMGIQTSVHYEPIYLEPYYQETGLYSKLDLPNANEFGSSVISLPTYPSLRYSQQKYIISCLIKLV